jgi:hypothetical protein
VPTFNGGLLPHALSKFLTMPFKIYIKKNKSMLTSKKNYENVGIENSPLQVHVHQIA